MKCVPLLLLIVGLCAGRSSKAANTLKEVRRAFDQARAGTRVHGGERRFDCLGAYVHQTVAGPKGIPHGW